MVPEEDLKAERERWLQQCMHEVWNLENAAFERINNQIEEATRRIQNDVTRNVLQRLEDERGERVSAVSELRRDLSGVRSMEAQLAALRCDVAAAQASVSDVVHTQMRGESIAAESGEVAVQAVRKELDLRSAQLQAGLSALQALAEQGRLSSLGSEGRVTEVRLDFERQQEQQEIRVTNMLTEMRQELSTMQVAQMQALQEQTMRTVTDLGRSIQGAAAVSEAAQKPLRTEFKAELEKLRYEVEAAMKQADEQASALGKIQAKGSQTSDRLEEVSRKFRDLQQDQLSETTMLRGRIENAVGERQESMSQFETIQLLLKEEQGRRAAELASVSARIEASERRLAAQVGAVGSAAAQPALGPEVSVLAARLESAERQISQIPSAVAAATAGLQARSDMLNRDLAAMKAMLNKPLDTSCSASREEFLALTSAYSLTQEEVARLGKDLDNERRDRCRALSDLERITEDVARATAATIERAERRLAGQAVPRLVDGGQFSPVATPTLATHTPSDIVSRTPSLTGVDSRGAMASTNFARLIGEMDAELRIELTSRIRLLTAELRGELLREITIRLADAEAKAGVVEVNVDHKIQRVAAEFAQRLGRLEGTQLNSRVAALENDAKHNAILLSALVEDHARKVVREDLVSDAPSAESVSFSIGRLAAEMPDFKDEGRGASLVRGTSAMRRRDADMGVKVLYGLSEKGPVSDAYEAAPSVHSESSNATSFRSGQLHDNRGAGPLPCNSASTSASAGASRNSITNLDMHDGLKSSLENLVSRVNRSLSKSPPPVAASSSVLPSRSRREGQSADPLHASVGSRVGGTSADPVNSVGLRQAQGPMLGGGARGNQSSRAHSADQESLAYGSGAAAASASAAAVAQRQRSLGPGTQGSVALSGGQAAGAGTTPVDHGSPVSQPRAAAVSFKGVQQQQPQQQQHQQQQQQQQQQQPVANGRPSLTVQPGQVGAASQQRLGLVQNAGLYSGMRGAAYPSAGVNPHSRVRSGEGLPLGAQPGAVRPTAALGMGAQNGALRQNATVTRRP